MCEFNCNGKVEQCVTLLQGKREQCVTLMAGESRTVCDFNWRGKVEQCLRAIFDTVGKRRALFESSV